MNINILEQEINLNNLFTLNYNFEELKLVIEALILASRSLNGRIHELENEKLKNMEKDDRFNKALSEFDLKFSQIFSRLGKNEADILDIYSKLKDCGATRTDLDALKKKVEEHSGSINKHSNQIDDLYSKIKQIESQIAQLDLRINNIKVYSHEPIQNDDLSNSEKFLKLLESLRSTVNEKFSKANMDIENNKNNIDDLRNDVNNLKEMAKDFKSNISNLFEKIEELKLLIMNSKNDEVSAMNYYYLARTANKKVY